MQQAWPRAHWDDSSQATTIPAHIPGATQVPKAPGPRVLQHSSGEPHAAVTLQLTPMCDPASSATSPAASLGVCEPSRAAVPTPLSTPPSGATGSVALLQPGAIDPSRQVVESMRTAFMCLSFYTVLCDANGSA